MQPPTCLAAGLPASLAESDKHVHGSSTSWLMHLLRPAPGLLPLRPPLQPVDPRIHFALNCGAASCPPIRVYTPDRLEFGLEAAASAFCASEWPVGAGRVWAGLWG